jgi:regulator of sirC expression with transglutaminase-like and TPR domain
VKESLPDLTARFAELVVRPEAEIGLDEGALLIASHAHELDLPARRRELDQLARAARATDADSLARFLFVHSGFVGNTEDYGDPRNSYLDAVLDRRTGLPIALSVLMIEVGRRCGISLHGVGLPGHFLVGAETPATGSDIDPRAFYDPFVGGAKLDASGCETLFSARAPGHVFRSELLAPVGPRRILDRMLANLQHTFLAREPAAAVWAVRLRLLVPGRTAGERAELAAVLWRLGRTTEAATALEDAAAELPGARGDRARRTAAQLRARAN